MQRVENLNQRILPLLILISLSLSVDAQGAPPKWLSALHRTPISDRPPETGAVTLLDEARTVVDKRGEVKTFYRVAYRILTSSGQSLAWVQLPFDGETRISRLKGWNLKPDGVVHEVGEKESLETQLLSGSGILFEDSKSLLLQIPQVVVGSVIAYEYERRHRPYILQDFWTFQEPHPVLHSRFTLELPSAWRFRYLISNHEDFPPQELGNNRWVWELKNLPGIPEEQGMPPMGSIAPQLSVAYFPEKTAGRGLSFGSWEDVARWANGLIEPRTTPSAAINRAALQFETWHNVAEFVQREIRYVAIEIGIGGYQPHSADSTFQGKYGDCKDKVTLLKSFCQVVDLDVYPVLIHTERDLVPEFPSPLHFNHMIAAIPIQEDERAGPAILTHPELGRLMLFDPTDSRTPLGRLPSALQGRKALLLHGDTPYLIDVPVASPVYNRMMRTGRFRLSSSGRLEGEVKELYWGVSATRERSAFVGNTHREWIQAIEGFLARYLPGVGVAKLSLGNVEGGTPLAETYSFAAPYFGQTQGELMLFRPCVMGTEAYALRAAEERRHPLQFGYLRRNSDIFEITLPDGFVVEGLPEPKERDLPFCSYRAEVTQKGNTLKYTRTLQIKELTVPAAEVAEVRKFYRLLHQDERSLVLLRRLVEASGPPIQ